MNKKISEEIKRKNSLEVFGEEVFMNKKEWFSGCKLNAIKLYEKKKKKKWLEVNYSHECHNETWTEMKLLESVMQRILHLDGWK